MNIESSGIGFGFSGNSNWYEAAMANIDPSALKDNELTLVGYLKENNKIGESK